MNDDRSKKEKQNHNQQPPLDNKSTAHTPSQVELFIKKVHLLDSLTKENVAFVSVRKFGRLLVSVQLMKLG